MIEVHCNILIKGILITYYLFQEVDLHANIKFKIHQILSILKVGIQTDEMDDAVLVQQ